MLDFNFHITAPRLYLTYLDSSNRRHTDMLIERFNNSDYKFYPRGPDFSFTLDDAHYYIDGVAERLEKTGWGRYVVLLRPEGEIEEPATPFSERSRDLTPIGVVSMQYKRFEGVAAPDIPDVGFGLSPWATGKGYAAEAGAALMSYFEKERGIKAFAGFTDVENLPARKLLGKLGMEEVGVGEVSGITPKEGLSRVAVFVKGVEGGKEGLQKVGITILDDIKSEAVVVSSLASVSES